MLFDNFYFDWESVFIVNENGTSATKSGFLKSAYEWIETFGMALLGVVLIFTFVCRFVTVKGPSMEQTFHDGDRLIISKLLYKPKSGDVVVIQDPMEKHFSGPIIKRVIATAGETVDIDNETWEITVTHLDGKTEVLEEEYANKVYFDGDGDGNAETLSLMTDDRVISDYYYPGAIKSDEFPHVVSDGCVFVLGDNRTNSLDSRYVGDIDQRKILGKVYFRLFPLNKIGFSFK